MTDEIANDFAKARQILGWGRKNLAQFDFVCRQFFASRPFKQVTEVNSDSTEEVVKVVATKRIPSEAEEFTLTALMHITHSFDHAVNGAARTLRLPPKELHFPWRSSPDDLRRRLKGKIPPELWAILESFEPYPRGPGYPGGNDLIRELAKKTGGAKHSIGLTLIPNSSSMVHNAMPYGPIVIKEGSQPFMRLVDETWNTVDNELVLVRQSLGFPYNHQFRLVFNVGFAEPGPLFGHAVMSAGLAFAEKAEQVINRLEAGARDIITRRRV